MKKIRAAVVGYGNIGHYALQALEAAPDFEVAGIVRRNGAENKPEELARYDVVKDIRELQDVDVAILATPTRSVEKYAKEILALGINTVDSFDIHTQITSLRRSLDESAKAGKAVSVISAGWDPGSDSVVRAMLQAIAPKGITYTNFGPGMSMGHTVAVKAIEGVKAALSMTIPMGTGVHRRMVYIELEEGYTFEEANDKMFERNYFGMMMVETGEADAFITGVYTKYSNTIKVAKEVIGIQPEYNHFGTMHIMNSKKGTYFLADTLINRHPDTETMIDIARLSEKTVRFFNHEPVIAMLSYSNFGTDTCGSPASIHKAVEYMQENYPNLPIDGEMQVNFAMNNELRDRKYPFTRLQGKEVNTLVFPNLSSANAGYQLLQALNGDEIEMIGPIQMGLNKPIHFTDFESSVRDIVNITAVAVIDAIVMKKKNQ